MKRLSEKIQRIKRKASGIIAVTTMALIAWLAFYSFANALTREENDRAIELAHQGYSDEEISKILQEEFGYTVVPPNSDSSQNIPSTGTNTHTHTWKTEITKAATCTEKGEQTSTCTECGATKTKAVPKAEHTYTVVTQPGTCLETANEIYTCTVCGYSYTKEGKKGEHDYELTSVEPGNCQTTEKKTYICSVCGDSYIEEGELGEHDYQLTSESEHDPCTESGVAVYTCSVCGDSYTEAVEPLGHDLSTKKTVIKEATCTTEGKKAYICKRCGAEVDPEPIPATGHTPQYEVIKESGVFTTGNVHTVCTVCGEVLSEEELPATIPEWVTATAAFVIFITIMFALVALYIRKRRHI